MDSKKTIQNGNPMKNLLESCILGKLQIADGLKDISVHIKNKNNVSIDFKSIVITKEAKNHIMTS
jgi:hypothetical protein